MNSYLTITKPQYSLSVSLLSLLLFVNISNFIFLFPYERTQLSWPSSMSDDSMVGLFSPSTIQVWDTELKSSDLEKGGQSAKPSHWSCLAHFWGLLSCEFLKCLHQAFLLQSKIFLPLSPTTWRTSHVFLNFCI